MAQTVTVHTDAQPVVPAPMGLLHHFSHNRGALVGLALVAVPVFLAISAHWSAPYSPFEQFRDAFLVPPGAYVHGNRFWLGTDDLGRDILSRIIYGARVSMLIGLGAVALSLTPGAIAGLVAAFFPRLLGPILMRITDIMMALPGLLLAIVVVAVVGPGLTNTLWAIAIVAVPSYVRLARSAALVEMNKEYVTASRIAGARTSRLMFNTVLPNCTAPLIVQATLGFSSAILDAAALGFLGLGAQPPTPEWGTMLANARDYVEQAWWVVTLPGFAIFVTVLGLNLLGDGLRDVLDPKLKSL
jgi:dipeptide transport system permease protein